METLNELTRFIQLRSTQKISKEEKKLVGLPLYLNEILSDLANYLQALECNSEAYSKIIDRYEKQNKGANFIEDKGGVHPLIWNLYEWLDYKAKPIRFDDFKDFIEGNLLEDILQLDQSLFESECIKCSDNFLIRVFEGNSSYRNDIDLQLLVRTCRIIDSVRREWDQWAKLKYRDELLIELLTIPILLPPKIINHRCCQESKVEIPKRIIPARNQDDPASTAGKNDDCDCDCKCDECCKDPSDHCICLKAYTFMADLFVVKEKNIRYEKGEIADIEVTMAGEMKERVHRTLFRTEDYTETETEVISSEERDHQVSERFSLQNQVKKTVETDLST